MLVLAFGFKLDDDVDEFGGFRDDDFADFAVGGEFLDVGVGEGESLELVGIREEVRGDGEFCAEFAIDLDDDFDGVGGEADSSQVGKTSSLPSFSSISEARCGANGFRSFARAILSSSSGAAKILLTNSMSAATAVLKLQR